MAATFSGDPGILSARIGNKVTKKKYRSRVTTFSWRILIMRNFSFQVNVLMKYLIGSMLNFTSTEWSGHCKPHRYFNDVQNAKRDSFDIHPSMLFTRNTQKYREYLKIQQPNPELKFPPYWFSDVWKWMKTSRIFSRHVFRTFAFGGRNNSF